jgi:hypothetical protein
MLSWRSRHPRRPAPRSRNGRRALVSSSGARRLHRRGRARVGAARSRCRGAAALLSEAKHQPRRSDPVLAHLRADDREQAVPHTHRAPRAKHGSNSQGLPRRADAISKAGVRWPDTGRVVRHGSDSRVDCVVVTVSDHRTVCSPQPAAADRRPPARGVAPPRTGAAACRRGFGNVDRKRLHHFGERGEVRRGGIRSPAAPRGSGRETGDSGEAFRRPEVPGRPACDIHRTAPAQDAGLALANLRRSRRG